MVLWVGSPSKGKLSLYFSLKEESALTVSALMPRMATPSLSKSSFASRNSDASTVQPEVLALGKKKRRTRWPVKSLSATSLPSSDLRRKAGTLAPSLSMDSLLHQTETFGRPQKRWQAAALQRIRKAACAGCR